MILNVFSVLAAFTAALRVVLALLVLALGVHALRRARRPWDGVDRRQALLLSLAAVLVGLAVVSWPLLYLLLQSYVPEYPGVMCILGVTRVGTGSVGAAAHLPSLVTFLEVTKPALVFAAGAWLALHVAQRRTGAQTARVTGALLLCGALAAVDASAELAYVFIPKQEKLLAAGCCAVRADTAATDAPALALTTIAQREPPAPLTAAFFGSGLVLVLLLTASLRPTAGRGWRLLSLLGAGASLPLGLLFLRDVAAPAFLGLPAHACAYCLISGRPESLVGIVLYALAAFSVGWACTVHALTGTPAPGLLRFARFGYLAALLMMATRLVFP